MLVVFHALATVADSSSKSWEEIVPWGAFVAGIVAVGVAVWTHLQNRRDRRRSTYSEAYRAALTWTELYYRVRRRDPDAPHELVPVFHEAQETIAYHEGWLMTESPQLGRAYGRFVRAVKEETRPRIQRAWSDPPCHPEDGLEIPEDGYPQVEGAKNQFLRDVRDHLSLSPLRWNDLKKRYPEAG